MDRIAKVERRTFETQIDVEVNLDGAGTSDIDTGIGFFDHMLDQIARHGLFGLSIKAEGDLHIDTHHTVEDIGITLGQAFAKALTDKNGIFRYGSAYVPLDEALSRVVVDLSGRPGLEYSVNYVRGRIGDFDVDVMDLDRKLTCPALVLSGADSVMDQMFDMQSVWASRLEDMRHIAVRGGHFFVDQNPDETLTHLKGFLNTKP